MNWKTTLALLLLAGCALGVVLTRGRLPSWLVAPSRSYVSHEEEAEALTADSLQKIEIVRPKPIDEKARLSGVLGLIGQPGGGFPAIGPALVADPKAGKTDVETILLERAGDAWVMPGNWPTRAAEVNRLVELLTSHASRFEPIAVGKDNENAHGTDKPTITVNVTTKAGKKHVLRFSEHGDGPAFDRPTYLRMDEGKVLRLGPRVVAALDRPAEYYLQRRLFPTAREPKDDNPRERVDRLAAKRVEVEQIEFDLVVGEKEIETKRKTWGYVLGTKGSEWELAQPSRDALDPAARDRLLEAVADLWAEKFVEGDDAKDEKTGLKEPEAKKDSLPDSVVLRRLSVTRDDGRLLTLRIGKQIGGGFPPMPDQKPRYYARLDGSERVFEINGDKFDAIFIPSDRLRDRQLARFKPEEAREIELTTVNGTVVLRNKSEARPTEEKPPPAEWRIVKPAETKADAAAVGKLLSALSSAQALDTDVAEQARWAGVVGTLTRPGLLALAPAALLSPAGDFGLTTPAVTVRVTVEESKRDSTTKKTRTFTVRVGQHDKAGKRLFVMSQDWPRVNAIDDELADLVRNKGALDYRDKRALEFTAADVKQLSVRRDGVRGGLLAVVGFAGTPGLARWGFVPQVLMDHGSTLTLERTPSGWAMTAPVQADADAVKAGNLVEQLGKLDVLAWSLERDEGDSSGLGLPMTTVTVEFEGDRKPAKTLAIGRPRDDQPGYYAKLRDAPEVFVVPDGLVGQLNRDSLQYRQASLWQTAAGDVVKLRIARKGQDEYALERKGNDWEVSGPFGVKAPKPVIDRLVQSLASPFAMTYAAHSAKDYAAFGLAAPAVKVTLTTKEGKEHALWFGDRTGFGRYARLGDKGAAVFIVADSLARAADQSALDFLDRELLRFDSDAAVSYSRAKGDDVLALAKEDAGWKLVKPVEKTADDEKVPALLKSLSGLRAERIVAYKPKDLKAYGLDRPEATVTVKLSPEAKSAEFVLELGAEVKDSGGGRYAMLKGGPMVGELSAEAVRRLMAGPLAYRDHQVARLAGADVVRLESGERKATFGKPEGTWKLTQPIGVEADHDALEEFVTGLRRLRADEFVAEKATAEQLKAYGLEKPARRWQFVTDDETKLDLLIGAEKDGRRYARMQGNDAVFLLDARLSARAAAEYRSRKVFEKPIDPAGIEGLKFGHRKDAFELKKTQDGWEVVGKPEAKVDPRAVTQTLATLRELKLERYVADDEAQLKLYGLDPAELTLEVTTEQGRQTLLIGGLEGGSRRRYARVPGGKYTDVFLLDEAASGALFRELGALTGKQ